MASAKQKKAIIDKLNDAFIERGIKNNTVAYKRFFDKAITESLKASGGEVVGSRAIKKALNSIVVNKSAYVRQTYNMAVLSGITNIIENQGISAVDRKTLAPLVGVLDKYPVTKPELLAAKVDAITVAILGGKIASLNSVEKVVAPLVRRYYNNNLPFIKEQLKINKANIIKVNKQIKSNISKTIAKELRSQINQRVTVVTDPKFKAVTRPKTFVEIRKDMRAKFGNQVDYRVRRLVDTEMHDLAENTKQVQHLMMGYTHKKWNSQGDSKVRNDRKGKTQASHVVMDGTIIPVKNKFKMFGGGSGMYPSDPQLRPKDRINCRCFLTYTRHT
jgi:hypothetical protein